METRSLVRSIKIGKFQHHWRQLWNPLCDNSPKFSYYTLGVVPIKKKQNEKTRLPSLAEAATASMVVGANGC